MEEYKSYRIKVDSLDGQRTRCAQIVLAYHPSAETRDSAIASQDNQKYFPNHEAAREALKERLRERKRQLLAEIAQLDFNIVNAEELYPDLGDTASSLEASFDELVSQFQAIASKPGSFSLGPLKVSNVYNPSDTTLYVLTLEEYGSTVEPFSEGVMAVIDRAMQKAGLSVSTEWNGDGLLHWSRRATIATTTVAT